MKPLALVVENDSGTRRLLDVLLSRVGLEVDRVTNGDDALIALQNVAYDVLLTDLLLPGRSGAQLLEWLTAERPHMLSRTIVLSSSTPARLEELRERWPALRTIRKPFELGEVLEVTQEIASTARATRTPDAAEMFCRHSMRAGAKAGVVIGSRALSPIISFGYTKEMLERFFPLPADAPYPLTTTLRHGKPLWLASVIAAAPEYPMLAAVWEANQSRALASVPVRDGHGNLIGAAGWSFREPRLFSEAEQQLFTEIAEALPEWLGIDAEQSATSAGT
jgi:two-component system, response regulator, stage 0 sporulation protein F